MRRTAAAIATALCVAVAGCGSDDGPSAAPVACMIAPQGYLKALRAAPDAVLLGRQTPISECLTEDQGVGDLADVGQRLVGAATALNQ